MQKQVRKMQMRPFTFGILTAALCLAAVNPASAMRGGRDAGEDADRATERAARDASRSQDRADRDSSRNQDRADRDTSRAAERTDRTNVRYAEERAKIMEDAAKDPVKAAEDLRDLEADTAEELAKIQDDLIKNTTDSDNSGHGSDNSGSDDSRSGSDDSFGSSEQMKDLAASENPEYDRKGFPVRRGEVVALDLGSKGLAAATHQGFQVIERTSLPALAGEVIRLRTPPGITPEVALSRLRAIDGQATFDYTHYYGMDFSTQGAAKTKTKSGAITKRSGNLAIGMIDTAVIPHKSLSGVSIKSRDFNPGKAAAPAAHGTAIASILAAEGGSTIYAANIFRKDGGKAYTSADSIVGALEWMVDQKVPVINMSLAGPRNAILDQLIHRAQKQGSVIVAAAGNGGPTAPPAYPAAVSNVVAVTAVDSNLRVYRYANQGKYITVSAKGVSEPAADVTGGTALFSGTSFATPHVSAWFARCLKKKGAKPASCQSELIASARDLGAPGHDTVYGYGYVK